MKKTTVTETTEVRFGNGYASVTLIASKKDGATEMKFHAFQKGEDNQREMIPSSIFDVKITSEEAVELATLLAEFGFKPRAEK